MTHGGTFNSQEELDNFKNECITRNLWGKAAGFYTNALALGTGNNFIASILIDSSAKAYFLKEGTASSNNQAVSGSKVFRLLAGQTIKINANFTTGSATLSSTASRNYISITRVGNY